MNTRGQGVLKKIRGQSLEGRHPLLPSKSMDRRFSTLTQRSTRDPLFSRIEKTVHTTRPTGQSRYVSADLLL